MASGTGIGAEAMALLETCVPGAGPAIHLAETEARARALARFLRAVAPGTAAAWLPAWDCLPYDWASPSPGAMGRRMAALAAAAAGEARLLVTSPEALLQRLPPPDAVVPRRLAPGDPLDPEALAAWATAHGYRIDDRVDEPGEIVPLGQVIDVFPAGAEAPVRLRVEDGAVADVSAYDAVTQRSLRPLDAVRIDAATEAPPRAPGEPEAEGHPARGSEHWLPEAWPAMATLADHLPGARLLATPAALARADAHLAQIAAAHAERARAEDGPGRRPLAPDRLYLGEGEWRAWREGASILDLPACEPAPQVHEAARPRRALAEAVAGAARALLVAATPRDRDRLARMAGGADAAATWAGALSLPEGRAATLLAPLDRGFRRDGLLVLTARDVLGHRAEADGAATIVPPWLADMQDLHAGDLVVHEEAGMGRYDGMAEAAGGEAIRVAFADGGARLVPAAEAGRLWRYGHDEGETPLDRLGGQGWPGRRAALARDLRTTARKLVAAVRARGDLAVPRLEADGEGYARVVAGFGFEETRDQAAAIRAVRADLASGRPMDRLLIGDVGFGKTEVAIRAIATAALAGAQVALIAPTTVLARQHALTIGRRLEGTGIEVAALSRLTPPAEARRARAGLASGAVRVVVGTHAVLGRATTFAGLGLVVIDEEQRFGRAHKAALRRLAAGVHVLSMSATPIPGTLEGALAGLRDLSLLATAPAARRPIRTSAAALEDGVLRDALTREWRRGGQSFVIVPRVEMVEPVAARLAALAPCLRLRVAHGDLPARRIDEEMTAFADGDGDVLLATAIVESGLDVPRANTMLVLRPELFGLSQLHQLRGRVGRGGQQAYCWLLTDPDHPPSEAGAKRLDALCGADALGAGFALSALDLDRRGPGDLFGDGQSGHEARVGPALHADMLAAALAAARGAPLPPRPEVRIEAEAGLPAAFIPQPDMRATLYNRIGHARTPAEAERLAFEVEDRFGPPPPEAAALLALTALRARAGAAGAVAVSAGPAGVAVDFAPGAAPEPPEGATRSGDRLVWSLDLPGPVERLDAASRCLEALEG